MIFNPFKQPKSLSEVEQDTEKLSAENENLGTQLSIAQKKVAIAKLKQAGLTPKHFNFDWSKILQWLKTH